MRALKLLDFLSLVFVCALSSATQAGITVTIQQEQGSRIAAIFVDGVFEYGDEKKFITQVININEAAVFLNSPGGNVIAAMEIGKIIRLKGYATAVLSKRLCASACALAWLSGIERFLDKDAALGFHASYINENGRLLETGVGNALVGRYLTQLNLPESAVVFVTSAPPEGMNWLTQKTASQYGIETKFFGDMASQETQKVSRNAPDVEPHDPLTTVSKFYNALARADGVAAAALVIPEKRGKGPFNEVSISSFFGSLKSPLKVESIVLVDSNKVNVTYNFVRQNGSICRSTAAVVTEYQFGRTLIERISASC